MLVQPRNRGLFEDPRPAGRLVAERAALAYDRASTAATNAVRNPAPELEWAYTESETARRDLPNTRIASEEEGDVEAAKQIVWSVLSLKMSDPTDGGWFERVDEDGDGTSDLPRDIELCAASALYTSRAPSSLLPPRTVSRNEFRNEICSYRMGVPPSIVELIFDEVRRRASTRASPNRLPAPLHPTVIAQLLL